MATPTFPIADSDVVYKLSPGVTIFLHDVQKAKENGSPWTASMTISEDEEFAAPYHFHPYGDEYMTVVSGTAYIVLAGKNITATPESGKVHFPRGVRHGVRSPKGTATVIRETAVPSAEEHNAMFMDMMSGNAMPGPVHAMASFYREGNTIPAFGDWTPDWLGYALVYIVGGFFGNFLGLAPRRAPKKEE